MSTHVIGLVGVAVWLMVVIVQVRNRWSLGDARNSLVRRGRSRGKRA